MFLYFAYGSNMSRVQMASRCPEAKVVGSGRLNGWRFHISTRGTATIIVDPKHSLYGVVWRCTPRDFGYLDRYEGIAWRNYRHRRVLIKMEKRGCIHAVTYINNRIYKGIPRPDYMSNTLLPAARSFEFPSEYLTELESWLPKRVIGAHGVTYRGRRHYSHHVGRAR